MYKISMPVEKTGIIKMFNLKDWLHTGATLEAIRVLWPPVVEKNAQLVHLDGFLARCRFGQ
jgi:hypothetical protein